MEADERVPFLGKKKKKEKEREKESKERGKDREKDKHRDSASERTDDDDEPDRPYKEKDKKDRATRAGLLSESSTEEEQTLGTSSAIPSLASFPSYPSSLLTLSSSLSRSSSSYSFDEAGLNLVNLPSEIIYRIFASLSPKDLLALQLSCAAFRVIVQEDYTWKRRLHDPLIAYYGSSPLTRSSKALDHFYKSQHLHNNWAQLRYQRVTARNFLRPVKQLRYDATRNLVAAAADCLIEVWTMPDPCKTPGTPTRYRTIRTHLTTARCFDLEGGNVVYPVGVRMTDIQIYDLQNEKSVTSWNTESALQGTVDALVMKENIVIAGGTNAVAWDLTTKQVVGSFPVQRRGTVNCIQYLPESNVVALSHKGKKVRAYDLRSGKRIATVTGHNHLIHNFRLNLDNMATVSKDRTARVWDVRMSFSLRQVYSGHTDSIHALQLDSWRILTGSRDKQVRLWDLRSGDLKPFAVIESDEPVFSLAADQSRLITGATALRVLDFGRLRPSEKSPRSPRSFVDRMMSFACWVEGSSDETI